MANSYVSGCGATVQVHEGWEASFNLRLTTEEIKIVLMGLKKRLKKAKTESTQQKFQLKIDELEDLMSNLPEKPPFIRESSTGDYETA
tara:strand:- start:1857 stop:2120 length:264 start_codon:yes stop_codon:yes gene_type:complete